MNKKNIDTYIYGSVYPRWVVLLADSLIIVASFLFAFIAINGIENKINFHEAFTGVLFVLTVNVFSLCLFKIPSRLLRYSSLFDLLRLAFAQTFSCFLLLLLSLFIDLFTGICLIPQGVIPIVYVLSAVLLISLRIGVKAGFELRSIGQRDPMRVMVYAAESKGADMVRRLRSDNSIRYRIKGFISDNLKMTGRYLMAIPVYVNDDKLLGIIDSRIIDAIIVDSVKMNYIKNSELVDELLHRGIKLITLSPVEEFKKEGDDDSASFPRNILIEDLLSKEPPEMDMDKLLPYFQGKRIMVTGAAGSIGRELVRQLSKFEPALFILVDQAETPLHDLKLMLKDEYNQIEAHTIIADVTNESRLESIYNSYHPQLVFHFAAYKHIPMLEVDVSEAIQVNVMGTCLAAGLAIKYGVEKFILASTDKAILPDTIMGVSKRIAEKYILALSRFYKQQKSSDTKFLIMRFGNILDSNGSVLLRFKEQIAKKENLVVTHPDVIRRFLTVREVACLVLETCGMVESEVIYTFDAGRPVKILDLAKRMISLSGYIPGKEIKIEYSGLRAGEKLSESKQAILNYQPSGNAKIFIVPDAGSEYELIDVQVRKLVEESYEKGNISTMIRHIKEIVPEFIVNECNCEKFTINNN